MGLLEIDTNEHSVVLMEGVTLCIGPFSSLSGHQHCFRIVCIWLPPPELDWHHHLKAIHGSKPLNIVTKTGTSLLYADSSWRELGGGGEEHCTQLGFGAR